MEPKKPRSYEENPDDQAALEQAITQVPVKDYSDYEIAIESKEHYEDALFTDEDDLSASLTGEQAAIETKQTTDTKSVDTPQPESNKDKQETASADNTVELPLVNPEFSFTDLLTQASREGVFNTQDNQFLASEETELRVLASGLNHSIASETIDYDLLLEDFAPNIKPLREIEKQETAAQQPSTNINEATSLKDKILKKAQKIQDKAKNQLAEVSGKNLPVRELPLEFILSATKSKKESEDVTSQYDINKLFSNKGKSIYSIMKQADEDLNRLSKVKMLYVNRLKLLNAYTEQLAEKIHDAITLYQRKPSLPKEAGKRLELIHHSQSAIKGLITGFKQVYAELYEANNVIYAAQHKTANETAFRLIDLLLLEQKINQTVHFTRSLGSAKVMNKIFHALANYETDFVDQLYPSLTLDKQCSARDLFIRYHVYSAMDLHTLSSRQHSILHCYIDSIIPSVEVLPFDAPLSNQQRAWFIYHDTGSLPPLNHEADQATSFKPLRLLVDRALNQIKKDYEEWLEMLGNQTMHHSAAVFEGIKVTDAITVMACLNKSVDNIERHHTPPAFSLYEPINAKAYSGLDGCYNYLAYRYQRAQPATPQASDEEQEKEPIKKPQVSTARWHCAMSDEQYIYLQTNEVKVGITLDIGMPLLILDESDEQAEHWLTLITRIERITGGKMNLVVEKVGNQLSNLTVTSSDTTSHQALLCRQAEQSSIITPQSLPLHSDDTLSVSFPDGSSATIAIDTLHTLSTSIQLASLQ